MAGSEQAQVSTDLIDVGFDLFYLDRDSSAASIDEFTYSWLLGVDACDVHEKTGGELRVTDLAQQLGGSQSNVSGHLQCLKECGLVTDRPEGRQVFYRIARPEVVAVLRSATELLACSGEAIALCKDYGGPQR